MVLKEAYVILKRTLKVADPKMHGDDVKALQRELKAKGFGPLPITGTYGNTTADLVLKAKKKIKGYPRLFINRQAGPTFAKRLTAYKPPPKPNGRNRFVAALNWALAHWKQIGYSQGIWIRLAALHRKWRLPFKADCSSIGIDIAKWTGNPSPSGSWLCGNTSSMLSHLPHIPISEVLPGDPIILSNPAHAVYALESGKSGNPWVFSHGGPDGNPPRKIRLRDETQYHPGQVTALRLEVNA